MFSENLKEQLQLGENAYREHNYSDALKTYKSALDTVNSQPDIDAGSNIWADINFKIIDVLDASDNWLDALMYVGTILNTAQINNNTKLRIKANLRAGELLTKRGKWDEARQRFHQTLTYSQDRKLIIETAESYYGLGIVDWRQGETQDAMVKVKKALDLVKDLDDYEFKGKSLVLLASVATIMGNMDLAVSKFTEAIELLEKTSNDNELSRACNNLGEVYTALGDLPQAESNYRKCIDVARRSDSHRNELYGLTNIAECLARQNKLKEAEEFLSRSEKLSTKMGDKFVKAMFYSVKGLIYFKKGQNKRAYNGYSRSIDLLRKLNAPYYLGEIYYEFAAIQAELNDIDEAMDNLERSMRKLKEAGATYKLTKAEKLYNELEERSRTANQQKKVGH